MRDVIDPRGFVRAIGTLLPSGCTLAFHDPLDTNVIDFLESNSIPNARTVRVQTLWPKSTIWYVAGTDENLRVLDELAGDFEGMELCIHFHASRRR